MLCNVSHVGVRYDSDSLYALVMISNEAKLVDHCPKAPPSREPRSFDDEARKAAGCLDVRVDRLRELHKVVVLDRGFWLHVRDGMLGIEVVFDHVSLLYDRCGSKGRTHRRCDAHLPVAKPRASRVLIAEGLGAAPLSGPDHCTTPTRVGTPGHMRVPTPTEGPRPR